MATEAFVVENPCGFGAIGAPHPESLERGQIRGLHVGVREEIVHDRRNHRVRVDSFVASPARHPHGVHAVHRDETASPLIDESGAEHH